MNQDTVKALLESLQSCKDNFSVTFTGKKSTKVNGLYKPLTREILLHNQNFKTDNQLLYTAIHEYAHHLVFCNTGNNANEKAHTAYFWATFHELLQKAEESGIYTLNSGVSASIQNDFNKLISLAKQADEKIATGEKELSIILNNIQHFCDANNMRYEDILDRKVNITRSHAKKLTKVVKSNFTSGGFSTDQKTFLLTLPNVDKKEEAIIHFENGKTIEQVKLLIKNQTTAVEQKESEEKINDLHKQKGKLENTVEKITTRIKSIITEIQNLRARST